MSIPVSTANVGMNRKKRAVLQGDMLNSIEVSTFLVDPNAKKFVSTSSFCVVMTENISQGLFIITMFYLSCTCLRVSHEFGLVCYHMTCTRVI